jgi:type IV pilus assembly protein PilW
MMLHIDSLNPTTPGRQRGLSLVELMISLTIGLILLMGITTLIVQQSSTRNELEKSSRQIENGRYASQMLRDDIEHAGYYGLYSPTPGSNPAPPAAMPDPCLTTPVIGSASLQEAMTLPVQGYDVALTSTAGSPIACLATENYKPGTDILVIRRVDTTSIPSTSFGTLTQGEVYLQTITSDKKLDLGQNSGAFTLANNTLHNTSVANVRAYLVHIYYISPCDVPANGSKCQVAANGSGPGADGTGPDDNGRPIPTLKRLELSASGGNTVFNVVPLVEGIENMQLDYGIDSSGDGYPDNNYTTVPANTTDWSDVMNVRINLLAQNTECTTGFTDTKTYDMGNAGTLTAAAAGATVAPCSNGDYKRHVFTEVVRVVNPSSRRAQE